jgi:carbon monoxide dehydrogenase subunit G
MATVRTELRTSAHPDDVWAAFRDFGAVHERLAPGFVVATRLEPGARVVTFANGMIAREALITMDDARRRLVYAVTGNERLTHHSASFEVLPDGTGARVVWTADMLPDAAADTVGPMMEAGTAAMAKRLG